MMRQKQQPFFSTLPDAELDLSDMETSKETRAPDGPRPEFSEIMARALQKETPAEAAITEIPQPVPSRVAADETGDAEEPGVKPAEETPEKKTVRKPAAAMAEPAASPVVVAASAVLSETVAAPASIVIISESVVPLAGKDNEELSSAANTPADATTVRSEGTSDITPLCIETALFVPISPGSFLMGSPGDEPGRRDDETLHEVTLTRGFWMQASPVTQRQWSAVMENNPSHFVKGGEDCPVEGVSWNDCQEFIRRLNKKGGHPYRLPTEAEWEYACRAGTGTAFYNGPITKKLLWRSDPCLDAIGWYAGNSGKKTHPVAQKRPNAWGLYDMPGNVCEWCQDWYGKYAAKPKSDPKGAPFGAGCVLRGGAWQSETRACRSASRLHLPPGFRCDYAGFRLVRDR